MLGQRSERTHSSNEVFLLGAGFSKAISDEMPLLTKLAECVPRAEPGLDLAPNLRPEQFESWLSFLATDQAWLTEAQNLRNRALFLDVAGRVSDYISTCEDRVLTAPVPPWLLHLVQYWHENQATVITFNYDVLVEKAYTEAVRVPSSPGQGDDYVSATHLYPVPVTPLNARYGSVLGAGAATTFRLLKLHGSTSWSYSGAASFFGETIYDRGVYPGWRAGRPPGHPDKLPLLIPPTSGKSAFFNNEFVRGQWRLAYDALLGASVVYLMGYSMPATDEMTRFLLAATLRPGATAWIVNTDRQLPAHTRETFPGLGNLYEETSDSPVASMTRHLRRGPIDAIPDKVVSVLIH
jgi:hypothetical protein